MPVPHPWAWSGENGPQRVRARAEAVRVDDHEPVPAGGHLDVGRVPGRRDEPAHVARVEVDDRDGVLTGVGDVQRPAVRADREPLRHRPLRRARDEGDVDGGDETVAARVEHAHGVARGVGRVDLGVSRVGGDRRRVVGLERIVGRREQDRLQHALGARVDDRDRAARPVRDVRLGRVAVEGDAERVAGRPQVDRGRGPARVRVDDRHLVAGRVLVRPRGERIGTEVVRDVQAVAERRPPVGDPRREMAGRDRAFAGRDRPACVTE